LAVSFVEEFTMPIPFRFLRHEGKIRGLEETYEKWKANHIDAMLARDADELVDECNKLASETERIWNRIWSDLNTGVKFDLELLGKFVDGFFTRAIRLFVQVIDNATQIERETKHSIAGLDSLKRVTAYLEALHKRIMANWPWQDQPWPPLDKAMQQRSRSLVDGPGEDVEDIVKRLNTGGPVIRG